MPTGPGDILELIRHGRATTRGDVLELDRSVADDRGAAARCPARRGIIVEGETDRGHRRAPPAEPGFNTSQSRVLVAAVDTTHTRIAVTDLGGRVLWRRTRSTSRWRPVPSSRARPDRDGAWPRCWPSTTSPSTSCAASGSACPARSTRCRAGPASRPILPGWDAYPVAEHLQAGLPGVPVLTANDADAAALGEYAAGYVARPRPCAWSRSRPASAPASSSTAAPTPGPTAAPATSATCGSRPRSDALCQCGMPGLPGGGRQRPRGGGTS